MGYSEALEQQVALLDHWRSRSGLKKAGEISRQHQKIFGQSQSADQLARATIRTLEQAETYFVSHEIVNLVQASAGKLSPGAAMTRDVVPAHSGFLYFSRAIPIGVVPGWEWAARSGSLWFRALAWGPGESLNPGEQPRGHTNSLCVDYYAEVEWNGRRYLDLISNLIWPFGEQWDGWKQELIPEGQVIDAADQEPNPWPGFSRSWLLAFLNFVQQHVLVAPKHRAERHAVKRLERDGWTHEPLIRVVELRRKASQHQKSDDPSTVAWSHQWVVSGHWRQQPYPSLGIVQPKWIMPYVKGPEDQPLKAPRAKVFAVVH